MSASKALNELRKMDVLVRVTPVNGPAAMQAEMQFACQVCGVQTEPQLIGSDKDIEKVVTEFVAAHKHGGKKAAKA